MAVMNNEQLLKMMAFKDNQLKSAKKVSDGLAMVADGMRGAIQHQCYMHMNPDGIIDESNFIKGASIIEALMVPYAEVVELKDDVLAVKNGTMTPEELLAKYPFDLSEYSAQLD